MMLYDSRAKWKRAKHHLEALDADIRAFLGSHSYRLVVEHTAEETFVARLDNPPTIPAVLWSVLLGDCVHNLRCALDYIAWKLAGCHPGDNQTQFPIFETEEGWNARAERRVGKMSAAAQAFLKDGQPFRGADAKNAALNAIRILDDSDKHKLLTVVAVLPDNTSFTWAIPGTQDAPPPNPIVTLSMNVALAHNAVIATLRIPDAPSNMKMESYFAPDVAFGESAGLGPRRHVCHSLYAMLVDVKAVIENFEARPELFPTQ